MPLLSPFAVTDTFRRDCYSDSRTLLQSELDGSSKYQDEFERQERNLKQTMLFVICIWAPKPVRPV